MVFILSVPSSSAMIQRIRYAPYAMPIRAVMTANNTIPAEEFMQMISFECDQSRIFADSIAFLSRQLIRQLSTPTSSTSKWPLILYGQAPLFKHLTAEAGEHALLSRSFLMILGGHSASTGRD